MIKKASLIILITFLTRLTMSCDPFSCGDGAEETYEINYEDVEITAYNTAGFDYETITDSVHKNAFGLIVSITSEYNIIQLASLKHLKGFNNAMACSPIDPQYFYPDPISHIELFVINTETDEKSNVTTRFGAYEYYNDELITLEQLFNQREEWEDYFQLELVEYESIPNSAIFVAEAYLESGLMFSQQTEQINFYD